MSGSCGTDEANPADHDPSHCSSHPDSTPAYTYGTSLLEAPFTWPRGQSFAPMHPSLAPMHPSLRRSVGPADDLVIDIINNRAEFIQLEHLYGIDFDLVFLFKCHLQFDQVHRFHSQFVVDSRRVVDVFWRNLRNLRCQTNDLLSYLPTRDHVAQSPILDTSPPICDPAFPRSRKPFDYRGGVHDNMNSATGMSSWKPTVSTDQAAVAPWHHLIEPFRFYAFDGNGQHRHLLRDALQIRQQLYRQQFGNTPLADTDAYDGQALHIVAYLGDEAVSSCRIVSQNMTSGLELARYVDLLDIRVEDRLFAEISRLALSREHRRITSRSFLLLGLLKTTLAVAQVERLTDYLIWVRPGLPLLYRSFGFVDVPGLSFPHPQLGNVIHKVMRLDMRQLQANWRLTLSKLYFDPLPPNIVLLLNEATAL